MSKTRPVRTDRLDLPTTDVTRLRDLAKRVAEIAALPINAERRALWTRHNALDPARPMMLVFPEGAWRELLPTDALACENQAARGIERNLRMRIYTYEHFRDDSVIEADWVVGKAVRNSGWGVSAEWDYSDDPTGARKFHPVIHGPGDLARLAHPVITHDADATARSLADARRLFDGILDVKLKGVSHVSFHMMSLWTSLRGLEQVMMDMLDSPGFLHDAMAFIEEGCHGMVRQYVEQNLLSLNNDGTYQSSGGVGYSDELPADGFDGEHVRPCDMWASAEAQELAQVSPEMHREFSLNYEKRLLEPFGLNGYGCCEDLTRKLDDVLEIPNIRRISISPWADVEACAEQLARRAIFSWKPHPAMVAGDFDPDRIRKYIARALDACARNGCVLEMVLKDTHTCEHHPERFTTWTEIARELIEG